MTTETLIKEEESQVDEEFIQTDNWKLPVSSLDGWRPKSVCLNWKLLCGPDVDVGHGLSLEKDLMGNWNGPRGSAKTLSMSYILAKLMRAGKRVWANYPVSFYVEEPDGTYSYYENEELDMDKYYAFSKDLRNGGVAIDELQYFVESRTSGKYANRLLGYQIMQIRKTANSFYYTVQNPRWVDNRFGWSADFAVECADIAKMPYDMRSVGRKIKEGEYTRWTLRDISGILTGERYEKSLRDIGPFQFDGYQFWGIYPTHFIIDIFDAMKGPDRDNQKKDRNTAGRKAVEAVLNRFLDEGISDIESKKLSKETIAELGYEVSPIKIGAWLGELTNDQAVRHQGKGGKWFYDISNITEAIEAK